MLFFFNNCLFNLIFITLERTNSIFLDFVIFLSYFVAAFISLLLIVISVAFFTVLERKLLAAIQRRSGPNMSSMWGLLQAFADGIKLLLKEPLIVSGSNYYIFLISPVILLTISLTAWVFIPLPGAIFNVSSSYSFLILFLFSGLNSYAIIISGISSNSRYSLLGGVRAIAQIISYEIPLAVCIMTLSCLQGSYNLFDFLFSDILYFCLAFPTIIIFFITLLAETNRTPFDLPEAEAELVAGYNLEYSAILFSLFFLAEYSNMLIAACLMSIFFTKKYFFFSVIFFCVIMIVIRAVLPRYTFKQLISLSWKSLFPLSILSLTITIIVIFFLDTFNNSCIDPVIYNVASDIINSSSEVINVHNLPSSDINTSNIKIISERPFLKAFFFFLAALTLSSLLVGFNLLIVNNRTNNRKNSPYECGFEPEGSPVENFSPNFIAVGIAFLIYDVEIILTYPFAIGLKGQPFFALVIFLFFILILMLSYAYEVMDSSFDI